MLSLKLKQIRWNNKTDAQLIAAYLKGKQGAFEQLYNRHKSSVFHFIRRQCNSETVAEEIAQETWFAMISSVKNYQSKAAFKTWLFQIAHNKLVDYWRKNNSDSSVLYDDVLQGLESGAVQPERQLQHQELLAAVSNLSEVQREAVLLRMEGFTLPEIAEITAVQRETIKSRLRYANKQLQAALETV